MNRTKRRYITWHDVDIKLAGVSEEITKKYDSLFGIPRAGLIVALLLSYKTGLPVVHEISKITPRTLVIEDIIHAGETMRLLLSKCSFRPDIFALYVRTDKYATAFPAERTRSWIIFPWEDEKTSRNDGTLARFAH